ETITAYAERIANDGEWGDGSVLSIASKCYKCQIQVYTQSNSKPSCINFDEQDKPCESILALGFVSDTPDGLPNHYISLISTSISPACIGRYNLMNVDHLCFIKNFSNLECLMPEKLMPI